MNGRDAENTTGSNTGQEDEVSGYGLVPETYFVPPPVPAEDPAATAKDTGAVPPPLPPRMPPGAEEEKGPAKW